MSQSCCHLSSFHLLSLKSIHWVLLDNENTRWMGCSARTKAWYQRARWMLGICGHHGNGLCESSTVEISAVTFCWPIRIFLLASHSLGGSSFLSTWTCLCGGSQQTSMPFKAHSTGSSGAGRGRWSCILPVSLSSWPHCLLTPLSSTASVSSVPLLWTPQRNAFSSLSGLPPSRSWKPLSQVLSFIKVLQGNCLQWMIDKRKSLKRNQLDQFWLFPHRGLLLVNEILNGVSAYETTDNLSFGHFPVNFACLAEQLHYAINILLSLLLLYCRKTVLYTWGSAPQCMGLPNWKLSYATKG